MSRCGSGSGPSLVSNCLHAAPAAATVSDTGRCDVPTAMRTLLRMVARVLEAGATRGLEAGAPPPRCAGLRLPSSGVRITVSICRRSFAFDSTR